MKVLHKSPYVLIVKTEAILSTVCGFFGLVLAGLAVHSYLTHAGTIQENIFFGQAAAAITLLLVAVVFFDNTSFVFDRNRRQLIWKWRTVFSRRSGSVSFDAIKSIVIQGITDSDDVRSLRVAVVTDKETLPLSKSYTGSGNGQMVKIAEKLNQWVLDRTPNLVLEEIKTCLEKGSRMDAAIALRKAYKLSMLEAKEILDHPERLDALPSLSPSVDDQDINSGDKELLLGILALITLVCGPLFLFLGINAYLKGAATESWPRTEAVVTDSGYTREIENDEFEFHLKYGYTVGGVDYTSNALYIKPIMNKQKSYSAIPKWCLDDGRVATPHDYPRGKTISIYYDPDDPQSAVVLPGVSGSIWLTIAMGAVSSMIYLFLARRDLRRRAMKKQKRLLV